MTVFKIHKNNDYVYYHLCDRDISLDAKGLLSQMMALPDGHSYSLEDIAHLNTDGIDAISKVVKELEAAGYIERVQQPSCSAGHESVLLTF